MLATDYRSAWFLQDYVGLGSENIAIQHDFGVQTVWDSVSFEKSTTYAMDVYRPEMIALNPWLCLSSRKRGRRALSHAVDQKQAETAGLDLAMVLSGVTDMAVYNVSLAVRQAGKNPLWEFVRSTGQDAFNNTVTISGRVNTTGITNFFNSTTDSAYDIPFVTKWIITCSIPLLVTIIVASVTFAHEYNFKKRSRQARELQDAQALDVASLEFDAAIARRRRTVASALMTSPISPLSGKFGSSIVPATPYASKTPITKENIKLVKSSEEVRLSTMELFGNVFEILGIAAWFMFVIAAGYSAGNPGNIDLSSGFYALMYIFGITGFSSCVSSMMFEGSGNSQIKVAFSAVILGLSCYSAGYITQAILQHGVTDSWSKLALTSATLYGLARAFSSGFFGARHSTLNCEMENTVLIFSMTGNAGWILAAVGLGRISVDAILNDEYQQIGPLGAVIIGAVACLLMALSSRLNFIPLIAASLVFSVLGIFFSGGLITSTLVDCTNSLSPCKPQQWVLLIGAIILLLSLVVLVAVRGYNNKHNDEKSRANMLVLRYQDAIGRSN